ncbi:PilZ domain-containing protein [Methylorubrum suomiense]|uniref:PilZ domain-containing protein n=1 Tax=Methylorubrum suomiense TaxID=144191 RepID=A0ABQ4UW15_9HYPH|nr:MULTISPECIES: PilZ domain-containing protein [Methylobacteriaceae]GJE75212.1 hypothetical protein BGCPKDLD_1793 [Methylorubrum suomiense]
MSDRGRTMLTSAEQRAEPRLRVGEAGLIALDEHSSVGCLVHDVSNGGVRITLPDAAIIPDVFLLVASCLPAATVCRVIWREDEMIGARFQPQDNRA